MICETLRKTHTFRSIPQFFGVLAVLLGVASLVQVTSATPSSGKEQAVSVPQDAGDSKHVAGAHVQKNKLSALPPGATTPSFLPAMIYNSGFGRAVAVADLNGDGKPDVVTANITTNTVSVLMGNGDGTFQPVANYGSGAQAAFSVAVADLNGDGRPDLAVGICSTAALGCGAGPSGEVAILLGNGDGTFQAPQTYPLGGWGPDSVVVADVNADGKPDLLATNFYDPNKGFGSVGVLLGNGDGTFQSVVTYSSNLSNVNSLAVADVNGDGKLDLLLAGGFVIVLLGNGDGTFQPSTHFDGGGIAIKIAVADVNGDGKPDLVAGNYDNSVGVLLGNGDGSFQPAVVYGSGGQNLTAVAVKDVNGDGKFDLIVANCGPAGRSCNQGQDDSVLGVLLGNGDGTFRPVITFDAGGPEVESMAVADLNGDGKPDLVTTCVNLSCGVGAVGVLLNNTAAIDTTPPVITLAATPKILWPPNGKVVPVTVSGTITDTGSGVNANTAAFSVKDEYAHVQPTGAITLSPGGSYSFTVFLQASRRGSDLDGRRYTLTVSASDNVGNRGSKTRVVTVPHGLGE